MVKALGSDGTEMALIDGEDAVQLEAFRSADDRCVGQSQRKVAILVD